jgi:hypothetical protein
VNRRAISGPPTTVMPLDIDEELTRWRANRPAETDAVDPAEINTVATVDSLPVESGQRRLRRLLRRR